MTLATDDCLGAIDVLVLAGGLGTRLRPAIGDQPKLLAPVGNQPFLDHLCAWLSCFGAHRVVLSLGYRAEAVLAYLDRRTSTGVEFIPVIEPEPLGTAGAIRFCRGKLRSDPVLVLNGDSVADADLCQLLAAHRSSGNAGTLLCTEVEEPGRFGRIVLDSNGQIARFVEKDLSYGGRGLISAGVYALSATLLDKIAGGVTRSLEREVFASLPTSSLGVLAGNYRFIDIGTPESLAVATAFFAEEVS